MTIKHATGFLFATVLGLATPLFADPTPAPAPAPAQMTPPVKLHVGDPAPALKYKEFIKGTEVKEFQRGQIYVVEFWATWCGWCKFSMTHLSDMAKKYDGKVTFVSMDVWEHPKPGEPYPYAKVEAFVNSAHDVMAYNVAADTEDGYMTHTWLQGLGAQGIPFCVVVDGDGKIAWTGHPAIGLQQALDLALAGKLDKDSGEQVSKAAESEADSISGLLAAMSEAMKSPDMFGKTPDRDAMMSAPVFPANPAYADMAIWASDTIMKMNTLWAFKCVPTKYEALLAKDPAAAKAYAEQMIADRENGPAILMALASAILNKDNPHSDFALAKEAMDKVMANSDPADTSLYATRALVSFKTGDAATAVTLQKGVVDNYQETVDGAPAAYKEMYRVRYLQPALDQLKEYQAGLVPAAKS